jgi:hypothetical protein
MLHDVIIFVFSCVRPARGRWVAERARSIHRTGKDVNNETLAAHRRSCQLSIAIRQWTRGSMHATFTLQGGKTLDIKVKVKVFLKRKSITFPTVENTYCKRKYI